MVGKHRGRMAPRTNTTGTNNQPVVQPGDEENLLRLSSKEELKFDIEDLDYQDTQLIDKLRPRKFKWRWMEDYEEPILSQYLRSKDITFGFIAEEMAAIDTEERLGSFGIYEPHENSFRPAFWRSYDLIALLVAEVQHLRIRVAQLESR